MAEGGAKPKDMLQVTVCFDGSKTVLHLPRDMKIGRAIQKAAEQFKQNPSGLTFLYHGNEITDDMTVDVALSQAHNVTVIHLIRVSSKKITTARVLPSLQPREVVHGYCRECDALVEGREVFLCQLCRKPGTFQRSSAVPINHFSSNVDSSHLEGACSHCDKENIQASVQFECKACGNGTRICILRQIRSNIPAPNVKCMKCGLTSNTIFRFACASRHCMCLDCFSNMCKQLLHTETFRSFGDAGFSIGCPGSGSNCKTTPVPDPHHFQIVGGQIFYERFKQMSIDRYQPSGDNILCSCKTQIDFQRSKPVNVEEPEGAPLPAVSGLRWYHKFLGMKPPPAAPRVRRRTSCASCQLTYCAACKQVWHEGDCRAIDDAVLKEEQAYPVDPAKANEGCWPKED